MISIDVFLKLYFDPSKPWQQWKENRSQNINIILNNERNEWNQQQHLFDCQHIVCGNFVTQMRGSFHFFIQLFIYLLIYFSTKSLNDSRGFVRTPDLSFLCLRKTLPMISIIDYFIYLSVFQRRCWDEHQVRCPQCISSIREQKKSQFHPFSTTTNFRFKSPRTVFIVIHFIFLEPRHLLQSGSSRKN